MTETDQPRTVELLDIDGNPYRVTRELLLERARCCIRERFSEAVGITKPELAREQIQVMIGDYEHEVFFALWLNNRHQVIRYEELFRGTVDGAAIYPREVVKAALACNASAVIFAHNHPSGNPEPSSSDLAITRRLKNALELIDIRILDHFIVGREVASMAELGLL
ncbi:MAG: DNA repair protein RadC [Wenzhouxiangellaceae bacterium]